ncbi:MAG: ATP cone domain-containing protein [Candidatus Aenigmarchaeota archaeon]|nr:ATP cone domain-containing protein [Candidatus Aenigmarchaeota archaeon]
MVKVKKRDGRLEEFIESKIIVGCKKAGATAKEAAQVAKEISMKVGEMAVVPAGKLSNMVVKSLKEVNKAAANAFVKFREKKLKTKKKSRY